MFVLFTRIVYTIFSSRTIGIFVIAKDFRFSTQAPGYHFPRRNYHRHTLPSYSFLYRNFATPRNTPRITKALYPTKTPDQRQDEQRRSRRESVKQPPTTIDHAISDSHSSTTIAFGTLTTTARTAENHAYLNSKSCNT